MPVQPRSRCTRAECGKTARAAARAGGARESGGRLVLHNLPAGDWAGGDRGLASLPHRAAEFRAGVPCAIAYAHALGVTQVNCLAGITPADADAATLQRTLVDNLRFTARFARMLHVVPNIEFGTDRSWSGHWLGLSSCPCLRSVGYRRQVEGMLMLMIRKIHQRAPPRA